MLSLLGLFSAAFLAATLLPAQSELLLGAMAIKGVAPMLTLWAVASAGNLLGSCVNWAMGRFLLHYADRRWFPVKPAHLAKAQLWYGRFGRWSLLAAWVPIIGDPLTLVAGIMREPLWRFVVIVGLAKAARYALVLWGVSAF